MGDLGLLGPGDEVFAPEEDGEVGGEAGGEVGGLGADEIEQAQFGGQIGEEGEEPVAVAGFQDGAEVVGAEAGLGVGDFGGFLLAGAEGVNEGAVGVFGGGGIGGGAGGGEGEEEFGQRWGA